MLNTTVGQLLVNDALPDELRDYSRVLDKKGVHSLLQQVARQHPEKYREVSFRLNQIGQRAAQDQGGMSFGIRHLRRSKVANEIRQRIQGELRQILADDSLTDQQRTDRIIRVVGRESSPQQKAVLEEAIQSGNPLGMQVLSGSRGKPMNLASLLAADMLYSDHRDEVIPIPVLRSYSEGLSPEEYWAGTYGARRGIIATKFATQEAGFLSKQLNQAGHRLVVMGEDGEEDSDPEAPARGMIVDTGDMDNEGALLARDAGPYKKHTPLTPKILKHLDRLGIKRLLIRSPLVGGSPEGGVYARDVGIRENGTLPGRGEQVGLQAAQALSEPISQGQLSAKHSGGVAGQEKAVGGFQYINQLIQVPKKMQGGASHATVDGVVQRVEPAPAGGHFVTINDQKHYVGEGFEVKVKKGDEIEAGDMLSDGIPNPAIITQYKGVGEGRRYFVNEFRKAMSASGMQGHRRNIELLARGLINHVKLTEETDDNAPDDIVPYSTLEHTYKPREGHERLVPRKAVGQYLERPVLHYTIGTKIRPSMLKDFDEFGVTTVPVHKNPPPFEPYMVRGMYQLQHDPDWMTQMYGSGLKKSLLESVARGGTSEERGTSFVPSLATGTDFGSVPERAVVKPQAPYQLPKVEVPKTESVEPAGSTFFGGKFKLAVDAVAKPKATTPPATTAPTASTKPIPSPRSAVELPDSNIMPTGSFSTEIQPATQMPSSPQQTPQRTPVGTPQPPRPTTPAQVQTDWMQSQRNLNTLSTPSGPTRMLPTSQEANFDFEPTAPPFPTSPTAVPFRMPQVTPQIPAAPIPDPVPSIPQPSPDFTPEPVDSQAYSAQETAGSGQTAFDNAGKVLNWAAPVVAASRTGSSPVANATGLSRVATLGRQAAQTGSEAAAVTGLGGTASKVIGKAAVPLAVALESINVGSNLYNKGWDQTTNDTAQKFRDILTFKDGLHTLYQAPLQVLSPVENVQMILGGMTQGAEFQKEILDSVSGKAIDIVTGTDANSRAAARDSRLVQQDQLQRQQSLAQQREKLRLEAAQSTTMSPQMKQQLQQQADELDRQIQDSQAKANATIDETENWNVGKQNWLGGGHKFRDAIIGTTKQLDSELAELSAQTNLTPEQEIRREQLENQKIEYNNLLNLYGQEVGYFGTGSFDDYVRNAVKGKKNRLVDIGQQLRSAEARQNPEYKAQLERDRADLEAGLANYRNWSSQAK